MRQSLQEPDPFRVKHRATLRQAISEVVRERSTAKRRPPSWLNGQKRTSPPMNASDSREIAEADRILRTNHLSATRRD